MHSHDEWSSSTEYSLDVYGPCTLSNALMLRRWIFRHVDLSMTCIHSHQDTSGNQENTCVRRSLSVEYYIIEKLWGRSGYCTIQFDLRASPGISLGSAEAPTFTVAAVAVVLDSLSWTANYHRYWSQSEWVAVGELASDLQVIFCFPYLNTPLPHFQDGNIENLSNRPFPLLDSSKESTELPWCSSRSSASTYSALCRPST